MFAMYFFKLDEQRGVFKRIMEAVNNQQGGVFFCMDTVAQGKPTCGEL